MMMMMMMMITMICSCGLADRIERLPWDADDTVGRRVNFVERDLATFGTSLRVAWHSVGKIECDDYHRFDNFSDRRDAPPWRRATPSVL